MRREARTAKVGAIADGEYNPALFAARQTMSDPEVLGYIVWLLAWTMMEEFDVVWEEAKRQRWERWEVYRSRPISEW